jgi:hypothetical protein
VQRLRRLLSLFSGLNLLRLADLLAGLLICLLLGLLSRHRERSHEQQRAKAFQAKVGSKA